MWLNNYKYILDDGYIRFYYDIPAV